MKTVRVKRINKDMAYVPCPTCDGAGSILTSSGGTLVHKLCRDCDGEGGMEVPVNVINRFIKDKFL